MKNDRFVIKMGIFMFELPYMRFVWRFNAVRRSDNGKLLETRGDRISLSISNFSGPICSKSIGNVLSTDAHWPLENHLLASYFLSWTKMRSRKKCGSIISRADCTEITSSDFFSPTSIASHREENEKRKKPGSISVGELDLWVTSEITIKHALV